MIPSFVTDPDLTLYHEGKFVALDFETTNEEYGTALNPNNRLVLACWAIGERGRITSKHYKFGGEYEMGELLSALQECDFIVAQNAKFELQWLDRCGYDIGARPVYDTFLAEWVITGNTGIGSLDLDTLAKKYGCPTKSRLVKLLLEGGVSPADIPKSMLLKYCMGDVMATHGVMCGQLTAMEGTRLLPIVYTRCLTTLALADIEKSGICLDPIRVENEYEKVLSQFVEVSREVDEITGGLNMNSGPQKAEFLYNTLGFKELKNPYTGEPMKTKGGAPKTDADTIMALVPENEEQRTFIECKLKLGKLVAAMSKTLDFCIGICRERGGIFFGELRQGTTRTHRLSSAGRSVKLEQFPKPKSCQFQNYPNEYKSLITARHDGWLVAEGDGSQLEFRVGGHLGDDKQIKWDIIHKEDIHQCTADALTLAGEPTTRREAKASTFKPMYGGTKGSPAVEEYCKFFANKYHELHTKQTEWALEAAASKQITTEWGMTYYFPKVKVMRSGYIAGQQQVFNYPIQALATGEIIPIGLVHFWYRVRDAQLIITNTVHDSIICEVPPEEIELFEVSIVQSLTVDVYNYLRKVYKMEFSIPLGVGIKLGTHWSESGFTDEELEGFVQPLISLGYSPVVSDGEISVDVPNVNHVEESE